MVLPLLLRAEAAAAAAAFVPGRGRVTLVTPLLTAAPPESAAPAAILEALAERVVATVAAAGLFVVLVMGARGSVTPMDDAVMVVAAARRAGTNLALSAALTDRVVDMVLGAAGVRSLLGPAPPGMVAVER